MPRLVTFQILCAAGEATLALGSFIQFSSMQFLSLLSAQMSFTFPANTR